MNAQWFSSMNECSVRSSLRKSLWIATLMLCTSMFAITARSSSAADEKQASAKSEMSQTVAKQQDGTDPSLLVTTVGMAKRLDQIVIPGAKLQVKPITDRHDPFILRIVETYPHGTDFRYDFEFYALEAGDYNLIDYLTPADSSSTAGNTDAPKLSALMVRVTETLPPGQILPAELTAAKIPMLGGYRLVWIAGGILWALGLYAIIFVGRKKKVVSDDTLAAPVSLADQLRPLVQAALEKRLPPAQRAALERSLIGYWCERLKLKQLSPSEAMAELRSHAQAGPLLRSLEEWLHRPEGAENVDVEGLLQPYADVTDVDLTAELNPERSAGPSNNRTGGGRN